MRNPQPMHYAGEIKWAGGWIQPGFAACCSGDRALKIASTRQHTRDRNAVTCKLCLRLLARHDAYSQRNPHD